MLPHVLIVDDKNTALTVIVDVAEAAWKVAVTVVVPAAVAVRTPALETRPTLVSVDFQAAPVVTSWPEPRMAVSWEL